MKPLKSFRLIPWLAAALLASDIAAAQSLDSLLRLQDYTAHRAASTDPSGGNRDFRQLAPGSTVTLAELEGPGVITHLWFTQLYPSRGALRKLVLRIYFDDLAEPCVEAPLGDFFGLGHARTYSYTSQPLAVGTQGGLNAYWPMPFAAKARLTVANEGTQACQALYFQIDYRKVEKPLPDGLHFFAAYRQAFPCEKGQPYVLLQTEGGPGHFVGCNLSVEQQEEGWWGEGNIGMFVDGEAKPAIAGTGTEDDFGGAWCYSHEFSFPQFGAPLRARFNPQGVLEHCTADLRGPELAAWRWPAAWKPGDLWNIYRYHIADPIPFRRSLLVHLEHGATRNERADWFASVAYWYQAGRPAPRPALPAAQDRLPRFLRPHDHGDGLWEGEDLADVAKADGGTVQEAGMEFWGDLYSRQFALQWEAAQPGNTLTLPFTVAQPGHYKLVVRLSRVPEGGTFKLGLDAHPLGPSLNLYEPAPLPALFETVVAETNFAAGTHLLKCVCVEPDPKAKGKRLLLDKFQVQGTNAPARISVPGRGPARSPQEFTFGQADERKLQLDVYWPAATNAAALARRAGVILLHGGAWCSGGRKDLAREARAMAADGYVVFAIDYRLCNGPLRVSDPNLAPRNRFPAALDDCQRAVRWIRSRAAEFQIDPDRLAAIGWSAGGHLAGLLGTMDTRDNSDSALARYSSRVNAVVDLYGPADFTEPLPEITLVGDPPDETADSWTQRKTMRWLQEDFLGSTNAPAQRDASPLYHVDAQAAPFLIFHGLEDKLVPIEQSRALQGKLKAAGRDATLIEVPNEGHGFARPDTRRRFTQEVRSFLDRTLGAGKAGGP